MGLILIDKVNETSIYLYNYMILSTMDINPHGFAYGTTKRLSTNGDNYPYLCNLNYLFLTNVRLCLHLTNKLNFKKLETKSLFGLKGPSEVKL